MSIQVVNPYWFAAAGGNQAIAGGGYNGAYGTSTDEFCTFNVTTDTWSASFNYPFTIYNQGGSGSVSDAFFFGGYTSTTTQEYNGTTFSVGGAILWSSGGQGGGSGSSGDGYVAGDNTSYGIQTTWAYDGTWATDGNLTYWQRQGAQSGDKNAFGIIASGFGGNTGGAAGASARSECNTRGTGAWGTITILASHQSWQNTGASAASSSSDFSWVGGYSNTAPSTNLDLHSHWNGGSWSARTVMPTGKYASNGSSGNNVDNLLSVAGHSATAIIDIVYHWDSVSWSTMSVYPNVWGGYGAGGNYS